MFRCFEFRRIFFVISFDRSIIHRYLLKECLSHDLRHADHTLLLVKVDQVIYNAARSIAVIGIGIRQLVHAQLLLHASFKSNGRHILAAQHRFVALFVKFSVLLKGLDSGNHLRQLFVAYRQAGGTRL